MNPGDEIRAEYGDHSFIVRAEKREDGYIGPPLKVVEDDTKLKLLGISEGIATYKAC